MNAVVKKIIVICSLAALPLLVLIWRNFFYLSKGWHSPAIQYQAIFWITRLLLSPLLVILFIKYRKVLNQPVSILFIQIGSLALYTVACWSVSFVFYRIFAGDFDERNRNLFNTIKYESTQLNLLIYVVTAFIIYLWFYFEDIKKAENRSLLLENKLAETQLKLVTEQGKPDKVFNKEKAGNITIKNGYKTTIISFPDIACFLSDGPYIKVMTGNTVFLLKKTMNELQSMLPDAFLRVHRSHIVNLEFVKEVRSLLNGDYNVLLKNGTEVRVSRTYRESLKTILGKI